MGRRGAAPLRVRKCAAKGSVRREFRWRTATVGGPYTPKKEQTQEKEHRLKPVLPEVFGLGAGEFFAWLKIGFVLNGVFVPAGALQDATSIFQHAGMAAEVGGGIVRLQAPDVSVLANQIIDAA